MDFWKSQRRSSGRVVATGRAVLALAFLLAIWLDPHPAARDSDVSLLLLSAYLAWTAGLMVIAWRSWWFDYVLAPVAQGVDIVMFVGAVFLAESHDSEFQSPFLAFAAFLLIAAMVRWNWRATALTAITLLLTNVVFGLVLHYTGYDIDLFRLSRRILYIVLLSSMLIWLSMSRGEERMAVMPEPQGIPGERRDIVLDGALAFIASLLGARKAVFAFASSEEPWIELREFGADGITSRRLEPDKFAEELLAPRRAALFDTARKRELAEADDSGLLVAKVGPDAGAAIPGLALHLGIVDGLVVPVQCATGSGQIILWDADNLTFDDISLLSAFGDEIAHLLDREEMARLTRVEVETGVRQAVARDLHDSVAQFLAGTLFRLEALRRWIHEGNDPDGEINSIKNALRREQAQLRLLIERLRRGQEGDRRTEIAEELQALLAEAGGHWSIATELNVPPYPLLVPVQLSYEIRQIVREAIANAARHGNCRKVSVAMIHTKGQLQLSISDDGVGFSGSSSPVRPRSISERVEALGGHFELHSDAGGARLEIALNTGELA
ncbi:histidine kinase [Novosphingobium sp. 17-62-19]|uniref:sensor histidine kinase n=1 Tax=Novosphingobium sp. 17-62-19 TaxID=1970406 RepID=UPI0025D03915|nr:histidine kinase [Novosphingobium sp. 17-62-19]HQS97481.1 histidine kinase [Novosphingobium sp.]